MNKQFFWNAWPKSQRLLFQTFLALLAAALIYYLIGYFWSSGLVIQWQTISKITTLPLLLESWRFASIPMDLTVDQYLINQIFEGSDLLISSWPALLLLFVLAACLILGLSLATDLSRYWFLASQVVFIFVMVGFKLEQLLLFNRTDKAALILAFLLYLPASYYFHAVKKQTVLPKRLAVFTVLTLVFGVIIHFYSGVSHPFLYLIGYGIPIPMALTVIFILFTGHEIIYGFLVLITRSNTPKSSNSFFHFFTLSLIYLGNVLLLYLRNTRRIEWDFYYLDAFWILIVVVPIGIWSLRQRGELFRNIMPVEPHAILGYMALATISFATIGYFFSTANDPAIEAFEDVIVFSQLIIGFVFLLYILFNFKTVLIANLKVYKVVYKPKKMPFFSMRLGGFIGVLGLFLLSNQYPLDQAITAYYNGIGDLHRVDNKPLLAKEYYKLAAIYAKTNHRSNYAIASMAKEDKDPDDALAYFRQSILKQPTPFAYVNTASSYERQGSFFNALFTLKDGLEKFPEDPHISNNLAMLYAKTDLLDSAFYFLDHSSNDIEVIKAAQTNQLALLARTKVELPFDSIFLNSSHQYPEVGSNLILMANSINRQLTEDLNPPVDTLLNPITFAWWYNYNLNHRYLLDSSQMSYLEQVLEIPENQLYSDNLDFSRSVRLYYSGDVKQAFLSLKTLQYRDSNKSGFYNDLLGRWSLQYLQPRLALDYFEQSIAAGFLPALWHKSLALVAMGQFEEAVRSWNTYAYRTEGEPDIQTSELLTFCRETDQEWDTMTDQEKAWYLQFKTPNLNWAQKRTMLEDIQDHGIYQDTDQWLSYIQASLSKEEGDLTKSSKHYENQLRNPFLEEGVLEAARYFRTVEEDEYRAYEILLDAQAINEYSVKLLKAYGEQCTRLNLDTYRQTALERLQELISPAEYQSYLTGLEAVASSLDEGFDP